MKHYLIQFERITRLHNFITSDSKFKDLSFDLRRDIIVSFFIHCFHLGDWLKASGVDAGKVDAHIHSKYELQICRNIANGTKHLKLDPRRISPPKIYDPLQVSSKEEDRRYAFTIGRSFDFFAKELGGDSEYLSIAVDGREIACNDLMKGCIEAWEEFFKREGLDVYSKT
jgi:hypothetical protein